MIIFITAAIGFIISIIYIIYKKKSFFNSIFITVAGAAFGFIGGVFLWLMIFSNCADTAPTHMELQSSDNLIAIDTNDNYYLSCISDGNRYFIYQYLCEDGTIKETYKNNSFVNYIKKGSPCAQIYKKTFNDDFLSFLLGCDETITIFYIPENSIVMNINQ